MRRSLLSIALLGAVAAAGPLAAGEVVEYTIDRKNFTIQDSLTGVPGDPVKGREVAVNRKKGNCLACHQLPIPEQPFHGEIGPPLNGIGARFDAAQLRLRVVDPKTLNPLSIMPSFHRAEGFHRVLKNFEGKPILEAQEVEDVIAYLQTLK